MAEKTDKEELIKVFQMLAQEEAKHKLALETLYDDHMAEMGASGRFMGEICLICYEKIQVTAKESAASIQGRL